MPSNSQSPEELEDLESLRHAKIMSKLTEIANWLTALRGEVDYLVSHKEEQEEMDD